jgi:GT2 family glycosyltransferase
MSTGTPEVVVVTPTRNRPELLRRAVESAAAQRGVTIRHVVVGDNCPALADPRFTARLTEAFPHVTVVNTTPHTHPQVQDDYRWARVGRLRNLGAATSDAGLIAHLDDDNTWDADHLSSLVAALRADPEAEMAHSWRRVLNDDGSPFRIPAGMDPWADDPETGRRSYDLLARAGVFVAGSNVLRDRLDWQGIILARVDTNELLVRRQLFERLPFPEVFSRWKQKLGLGDDAVWAHQLVRHRIRTVCTERVTVNYYMGGKSNFDDRLPRHA